MYGLLFLTLSLVLVAFCIVRIRSSNRWASLPPSVELVRHGPVPRHPLAHLYYAVAASAFDEACKSLDVDFTDEVREKKIWELASRFAADSTPPDGGEPCSAAQMSKEAFNVLKNAA